MATEEMARDAVRCLLRYIGEEPSREGLLDTPARVVRAWDELTAGYSIEPADLLDRDFEAGPYDQVIACPWIEFHSLCEHHLLPFTGFAHIAYLPAKKKPRVVGLSKMARLVDCFARRLQIQERMTVQIAESMAKFLRPRGVAVIIQAKHQCMSCRGVMKQKAVMVTSEMTGAFRKEGTTRQEFLELIKLAKACNE